MSGCGGFTGKRIGTGKEEVLEIENRSEGLDDTMIEEEEVLDNFTELEAESILDIEDDKWAGGAEGGTIEMLHPVLIAEEGNSFLLALERVPCRLLKLFEL